MKRHAKSSTWLAAWALLGAALGLACDRYHYKPDYCEDDSRCYCNKATKTCLSVDAGPVAVDAAVDAVVVDVAAVDAVVDAGPPDGPGTCGVSADCAGDLPICDQARGKCVACLTDDQCKGSAAKAFCVANTCSGCRDRPTGACRMRDAKTPVCGPAGMCLECVVSSDCGETGRPICEANKCVACTADAQCVAKSGANPGVCMNHADGRCATDDETMYVQRTVNCSPMLGTGGTAAVPFCRVQLAVDFASAARSVIVLRGPDALGGWAVTSMGPPLTVVGQRGVSIGPSTDSLLRISKGEIYVRDVTFDGSSEIGVVAQEGSLLRLNRCIVSNNTKGALTVANAGFDVSNSVFVGNGVGRTADTLFYAVFLGVPRPGGPAVFRNNTVVFNNGPGVTCAGASQTVTGLLLWQNLMNDVVNCTVKSSKLTSDGDPKLGVGFHLTAGSPCLDAGDAMDFPVDDLDGERRPKGAKSDCGADEF